MNFVIERQLQNIQKDLKRDNVSVMVRTANGVGKRPPQSLQESPREIPKLPSRCSSHDGDSSAKSGIGEGYPGTLAAHSTANEYMQELPESVQQMVGMVYELLTGSQTSECVM
jgi:hypothetical protein